MSKKNKIYKEFATDTAEFEATAINGETVNTVEYDDEEANVDDAIEKVYTAEAVALSNVWLRAEPSIEGTPVAVIKKDTKFTFLPENESNGFVPVAHVEIETGITATGFVMKKYIKEI